MDNTPASRGEHWPGNISLSPRQHFSAEPLATELNLRAIQKLLDGQPLPESKPLSWTGRWILWRGRIPRGKAKSPRAVAPAPSLELGALRAHATALVVGVGRLASVSLRRVPGRIDHPLLGGFSARDWFRFVAVHGEHHLAIVDDIQAEWRRRGTGTDADSPE